MAFQAKVTKAGESGWRETIKTIAYALIIAMVVRVFFFQPFNIPSGSMKETLLVGDYLFVSKLSYGYSRYSFPWSILPYDGRILAAEPKRGDVVVFKLPRDTSIDYIKRVIGLPGDEVEVRNAIVYINGQAAHQTPAGLRWAGRKLATETALRGDAAQRSEALCAALGSRDRPRQCGAV